MGPRVFTFFLYLNDLAPGAEGATWFPHATPLEGTEGGGAGRARAAPSSKELAAYYRRYNEQREPPQRTKPSPVAKPERRGVASRGVVWRWLQALLLRLPAPALARALSRRRAPRPTLAWQVTLLSPPLESVPPRISV